MANTLVKLKTGTISKLEQKINDAPAVQLNEGTVYFAIDTVPDKPVGQIVYDAPDGNGGVARIVMSTRAEYADDAGTANNVTGVVQVAHGGTGAVDAADARTNLGLGNAKIFYGTCSVSGGTAAKTVNCSAFTSSDLTTGAIIFVTFSNTNSAGVANLTMSVNGTTAKPIKKYYNYAINNLTNVGEIRANATLPFVYDGTNWIVLGLDYNSTWSAMSQDEAIAGTSTSARLITAAVLQAKIANSISNALSDTNAMIYKGTIATASDIPAIHEAGWTYKVATAGTYVGQVCEVGDVVLCVLDGNTANNDDWIVIQKNVDNALFRSTNTFTNEHMLLADGTNGKVKSVAINPTLTLTSGDDSTTPKFKISVGGKNSSESSLNSATTGAYGVTKLSNTASENEEGLAATPKLVASSITTVINNLDVTDSAVSGKYVSAVSETNGKISVSRNDFSPAVSITSGTADAGPTVGITVGGASSAGQPIGSATIGIYGVTKLSNTINANEEGLAATPKLVSAAVTNGINALDVTDTANIEKYVSAVSETNGKISVTRAAFSPSITVASGTSSNAPTINVTVAGNSGTAQSLNTATTGLYGVTKLSNTSSANEEGLAATPKGVWAAINTLDSVLTGTPGASKTATAFSQTDGKVTATFEDIAIAASQVTSGTLSVARGGTGQTSIANIKAGKDADGNTITTTYATKNELNNLLVANDAMVFKGLIMTESDVPAIHEAGWTYKVATFGTYAGKICEVGDLLICVTDNSVAANASDDHWMVVQTNVDNALFKGLNTYTDGHMLLADGTVGKVKSVAINPTITLTGGTASDSPKFKFTIGSTYTSNEVGIGTATTGIYGVTKLSDATNSTATDLAATANAVKKAYDLAASKTSNVGTITGVTAGTGLSGGGTSGNVTINHSNSITAINSEDLYKIKFDAQGHITGASIQLITDNTSNTDVTSTDTNLITGRTLYYQLAKKGYTTNTGTVTSVTAGTGLNTSADQADSATKGSITTTGTLYLTKSGVTAGSYGPSANATPAYNATFNVPYITVDAYGRVTAASTKTVKIPATDNTDTKQNITLATNLKAYVTGVTTAPTATANALTGVGDTGVYLTTTAGELNATQYKVNEAVTLQYNSTTKSLDFIFA